MVVIMTRSPYIIEVNESGQTSAKLELFVWKEGETEPTVPTFTLQQNVLSTVNEQILFNISPYLDGFYEFPEFSNFAPSIRENGQWRYLKLKTYSDDTLLLTTNYNISHGYNNYSDGLNYSPVHAYGFKYAPFKSETKEVYLPIGVQRYINFYFDASDDLTITYTVNGVDTVETLTSSDIDGQYYYPMTLNTTDLLTKIKFEHAGTGQTWETNVIRNCEARYAPIVVDFINKYGGWDFLTFFKKSTENVSITSKDYDLFKDPINFLPQVGEGKSFNHKLTRSVRVNTGWVHESTGKLIEELLCSDNILLGGKPAKIKTNSLELMKSVNGKLINYALEFEYNYNDINSVV